MKRMTMNNLQKTMKMLLDNKLASKEDNVENMALDAFIMAQAFNCSVEDIIMDFVNKRDYKKIEHNL